MAIWIKQLKLKLKKKYLYEQVLPQVESKIIYQKMFLAWLELHKKHQYLDQ